MKEDDFEDLVQGFASRSDKKGPRTIAEMRRQEMTKDTDPLKLKVTNNTLAMKRTHAFAKENVSHSLQVLKQKSKVLTCFSRADLGLDRREGAKHPGAAVDTAHRALGGRGTLETREHGRPSDTRAGEEVLQKGGPGCSSRQGMMNCIPSPPPHKEKLQIKERATLSFLVTLQMRDNFLPFL